MKNSSFFKMNGTSVLFVLSLFLNILVSCSKEEPLLDPGSDENATVTENTEDLEESDNSSNPAEETDETETETETEGAGSSAQCEDPANFIFQESNGLLLAEFEDAVFPANWKQKDDTSGTSGGGYLVWSGNQYLSQPGNGKITYKLEIQQPGTYQFLWKSAVTTGDNGTEHNDTWLRFDDASDFYGERNGSRVYPAGTGKTPTPEGASKDGWLKIYRSGNDLGFKWQARTSDNDAHDIFVSFDSPGMYTMEVSARSSGHAIDKFALFNETVAKSEVTNALVDFSEIRCN